MIREAIGKRPMRLSRGLWRLLRSTTPIRSAAEELSMLFHNAEVCSPPSTTFSRTVRKALRACFALLDSMQRIQVVYVEGFDSRADVVYNPQQSTLKVHRRWLDFDDTHQRTSCRNWILRSAKRESGKREPFFCGHIVEELLSLSISSVFGGSQTPRTTEMRYMRHIRRLLRYMPHQITLTPSKGGLAVAWEDSETELFRKHGLDGAAYHVILHEENCISVKRELLHPNPVPDSSNLAVCGCRQQFVPQWTKQCLFADLDEFKRYYAMVSLNERSALYGLIPEPMYPLAVAETGHSVVVGDQLLVDVEHGHGPIDHSGPPRIERKTASSAQEPRSKRRKYMD
ncbi:unnamed protein product [Penicillium manginii]